MLVCHAIEGHLAHRHPVLATPAGQEQVGGETVWSQESQQGNRDMRYWVRVEG